MRDDLKQAIEQLLGGYHEPNLATDLVSADTVRRLAIEDGNVVLELDLGFPCRGYGQSLAEALRDRILGLAGVADAQVTVGFTIEARAPQPTVKRIPTIRNVIAVGSAKGGVGKSTVAANLALALSLEGASVGVLDADIYGPSQPRLLSAPGMEQPRKDELMQPVMAQGLQTMSIGYLLEEDSPAIWRGPMVTKGLEQLLYQTAWGELDYLIVDLPPGTGDTQLTLAQKIPVSGAIIVTTPQELSLIDARRGLRMFDKVNISVLGVVENMSGYVCPHCGEKAPLFGEGGGRRLAEESDVRLLAELPLDPRIGEHSDDGRPTVIADSESEAATQYRALARQAAGALARRRKDRSLRRGEEAPKT